ncbi:MAG TPA: DUF4124 domain-containing protein [Rhodocyclaceae bacterium]|nr:DUF4124 domain-containing protein [Rhodocyclaceae bacterium]
MKEGTVLLVSCAATAALWLWAEQNRPAPALPEAAPTPSAEVPPVASPPVAPPSPDSRAYLCIANGQRSYSDRPCAAGERSERVNIQAPPPGSPTPSIQEQYADLVANRPRVTPGAAEPLVIPRDPDHPEKAGLCEELWLHIREIDEALRQPTPPQQAETLRALRLRYQNDRFTQGC